MAGFTMLPNEYLEKLACLDVNLNNTQMRILLVVIRRTLGYKKEWAWISNELLEKATGKDQRQLKREFKKLVELDIIRVHMDGKKRNVTLNLHIKGCLMSAEKGDYSLQKRVSNESPIKEKDKIKSIKEKPYVFLDEIDEEFIRIYCKEHKVKMGRKHVRVKSDKYESLMENLDELKEWVDKEEWERGVKEHFEELPENNNGSIIAFMHTWTRRFVG